MMNNKHTIIKNNKLSKTKQKRMEQHFNRLAHEELAKLPELPEIIEQPAANTMASDGNKTILDRFNEEYNSNEPIRELLSGRNVRFKTQLTDEQRSAVSILYHAYRVCLKRGIKFDGLKYVLDEYIDFGVSLDRKSREEFVQAHQQQLQNQMMAQQQQQQLSQASKLRMG